MEAPLDPGAVPITDWQLVSLKARHGSASSSFAGLTLGLGLHCGFLSPQVWSCNRQHFLQGDDPLLLFGWLCYAVDPRAGQVQLRRALTHGFSPVNALNVFPPSRDCLNNGFFPLALFKNVVQGGQK